MSSGTFGYPLGFAAMLAVIGLAVSGGPAKKPIRPVAETAAAGYPGRTRSEIRQEIIERCRDYVRKYPESEDREQFEALAAEQYVEMGDWRKAGERCAELAFHFPKSSNRGNYIFFEGLGLFHAGDVPGAIDTFRRALMIRPQCGLNKNARHFLARSYFLRDHAGNTDFPEWFRRAPRPFQPPDQMGNPFSFGGEPGHCSSYRTSLVPMREYPFVLGKDGDQAEDCVRMIRALGDFLARHPDDAGMGSTLCLLGLAREATGDENGALECYRKAAWSDCQDDVAALALDSAAALLLSREGRGAVVELCREFLTHRPESALTVVVAGKLGVITAKEGSTEEADKIQAAALKECIGDPSSVKADALMDEIVRSMILRSKAEDPDIDELDRQLVGRLYWIAGANTNATVKARIYYARARLARMLKNNVRHELFLKGIPVIHEKDLSVLSPAMLADCGDALLRNAEVDRAETMFRRLKDHFAETYGDVADVGLGRVALARKKPEEALGIFNDVLGRNPVAGALPGAMIGRLQALSELNRPDEVIALALESLDNKIFNGEPVARIYLLLGRAYETKADGAGAEAKGFLQKALGVYQRVLVGYPGYPELSEEAFRRADEVKKKF